MISFVMVGTNNLDKAIDFYDTLLNTIELQRVVTNEKYAGYAPKNKPDEVEFYVTNPVNKEKATFGNGTQISFLVRSGDYYCYFRDLDENKICAFAKLNN